MAKQTIITYPAVAKNSGSGTLLADAFKMINDNFTELYDDETTGEVNSITATAPISRDQAVGAVTLSLDDLGITTGKIANDNVTIDKMANDSVGANELVDNSVGAAALNVSGNGTAGYFLASDGDGTFSWEEAGDLTAIVAGSGLTGTDLSGPIPTLNIGAGTGITVAADAISLTDGGVTATQLGANSATPAKVSLFDDNTVATDTHILVADGTDYINKAVSGDATLANTGALTIANDAIITAKILDANITVAKMAANSVDSDQYVDGSIDTIHIADDQVTYGKLAPEFTTTDVVTTELDFGGHQVFTKIMGGHTTFTYANVGIGMVKDFILSGAFTPTFPVGTKTIAGTYSESALNFIQIVAQADGNYWMSISQEQ